MQRFTALHYTPFPLLVFLSSYFPLKMHLFTRGFFLIASITLLYRPTQRGIYIDYKRIVDFDGDLISVQNIQDVYTQCLQLSSYSYHAISRLFSEEKSSVH